MLVKRINPALLIVIGLPVAAVLASTVAAVIAVRGQDPQLPDEYHWEGQQLDQDFLRSRHADELGVRATLHLGALDGRCSVDLQLHGERPARLNVALTHGARKALDRHLSLALSEGYTASCEPLPSGLWHIELSDGQRTWAVREDTQGSLDRVYMGAPDS